MKSCGDDTLKELLEKYGPLYQMFLQRLHFHREMLSLAVLYIALQRLAVVSQSLRQLSERLAPNLLFGLFSFQEHRESKGRASPNKKVTE